MLSSAIPIGLIIGRYSPKIWEDPKWKPEDATKLASRILERGAMLVKLSDAKKWVDPRRWDQFASLAAVRPKDSVMILDRGRKLCLIGRLDAEGGGIQVTIHGKDYHWIVKPEWFEK
jgi:hypothetical protein